MKKINILYLHGYQGSVTEEKRDYLDKIGNTIAPSIDYDNEADIINDYHKCYKDKEIDVISGTSLGGFVAYYLALILNKPMLIFNPAVKEEQIQQFIPDGVKEKIPQKHAQIVIGMKDERIDPQLGIDFFWDKMPHNPYIHLHLIGDLEHTIPFDYFEEQWEIFLMKFYNKSNQSL